MQDTTTLPKHLFLVQVGDRFANPFFGATYDRMRASAFWTLPEAEQLAERVGGHAVRVTYKARKITRVQPGEAV